MNDKQLAQNILEMFRHIHDFILIDGRKRSDEERKLVDDKYEPLVYAGLDGNSPLYFVATDLLEHQWLELKIFHKRLHTNYYNQLYKAFVMSYPDEKGSIFREFPIPMKAADIDRLLELHADFEAK